MALHMRTYRKKPPEEWDNPKWIADHMIPHGQWMSGGDYKYEFKVDTLRWMAGRDADKFDKTLPALMHELSVSPYISGVRLEDGVIFMDFDKDKCVHHPCRECNVYGCCHSPAKGKLPAGLKLYDVVIHFEGATNYEVIASSEEEAGKIANERFSEAPDFVIANAVEDSKVDSVEEIDPDDGSSCGADPSI